MLSLFSGGGLGDYGLELAGMEIVRQVEIDEYCQKILNKRWPEVPKFKDIKTFDGKPWRGAVDLISGGFPCQPFSTAGRRTGKDDNRYLWPEMLRVIREVRPRWVLAENVPGLLSISNGRVFGEVVRDLAACGYCVEWDCIPASAVGAPHQRDRVWIVAYTEIERIGGKSRNVCQKNEGPHRSLRGKPVGASKDTKDVANSQSLTSRRLSERKAETISVFGIYCKDIRNAASKRFPDWAGGAVGQPSPLTEFERSSGKELEHSKCGGRDRKSRRRAGKESKNRHLQPEETNETIREIERDFRGMAHGVANRVDRLKLLGNGQVVQVVQWIGEKIMSFQKMTEETTCGK